MNITIIIGWVIAFGMVVFGIFQGGQMDWFIDPPSLAITIGGTIGCLIASYPLSSQRVQQAEHKRIWSEEVF